MGFLDRFNFQDALRALPFSPKGKSALGIDIGSSSVKVTQIRNENGVAILETYGELALGPYADVEIGRATSLEVDRLTEALRDILREANVTTKECGVSIPFTSSLISLLTLPAVDRKTLTNMIPLEARKYIPVPISEVLLDWFVIPEGDAKFLSKEDAEESHAAPTEALAPQKIAPASPLTPSPPQGRHTREPEKKLHVLLVAIHNEVLRKFDTVMKALGLRPAFYEIEIFSTIRSVLGRGVAPVMVLDIGAARSKIYIVEAGVVRATHAVNKGAQDITLTLAKTAQISITKAEEKKREVGLLSVPGDTIGEKLAPIAHRTMEYIFAEAERAILAYQRRFHANIAQAVLTGGGATLKGLLPLAQKKFEREVVLSDPFKKVQYPAFLEEVLRDAGPEFAVSLGLALRKLRE